MSYLSTALQRHAERRHLTQGDLARVAGVSRTLISRFLSGENPELSDPQFAGILSAFAADPRAQAELIVARCMDARAPAVGTPGFGLVELRIGKEPGTEDPAKAAPEVPLAQEAEDAFAWLRSQCPVNPDLEKHIIGLAKLTGMK